jgi:hypothetical protein
MFSFLQGHIFMAIQATVANYGLAQSIATVAAAFGTLLGMTGIGAVLALGGMAVGGSIKKKMDIGGSGSGDIPSDFSGGRGGGVTNITNEGDNVNVDLSGGDTASYEKFADMQSSRSRGSVDGSYTG